jgi:hypothetical protein
VSNYTLELFNGREYEPTPHHMVNPDTLADLGRDLIRLADFPGFRVVKAGHKYPKRVRRWTPTPSRAYARDRDTVIRQYLDWALARGLECVTQYNGETSAPARCWPRAVRFVDPADFIGPAPRAQIDPPAYSRETYARATA